MFSILISIFSSVNNKKLFRVHHNRTFKTIFLNNEKVKLKNQVHFFIT